MRLHLISLSVSLAAVAALAGCSEKTSDRTVANQAGAGQGEAASAAPFDTSTSIRELMDSTVDPAADGVWESVATVSDRNGVDKRRPRTEEEWKDVRRHAITLIEAMNLVMMKGRHAAPADTPRLTGELTTEQIDALLASDHETFVAFAQNMQKTTKVALAAIDKRDPVALFEAGSEIDSACEGCHVTFWYPDGGDPRLQHLRQK
ncbi:hypothetical protein [Sphingobium cloacae]|uniref:Cytochrome c n=1 Tax=Sphingobium cloacae TaxID=120107 RepID=A0A1E1F1R2_9SPHN|nr:hypothetical protein [Sphingobium cloacae]BAV64458.1 hypothetical protein SCLO_1014180 [Sphingobium cloacae]